MTPVRPFDMRAFHAALDAERRARSLSWTELADEINEPFQGTPSIPITPGTLRTMLSKRSVTSAVVLQALRWLGRCPESFLAGAGKSLPPGELFSPNDRSLILRFDTQALHAALDARRTQCSMTWKQVARELPGFTQAMLTNLAAGPLIGFPRVMSLTQWLGCPAADFVRRRSR